MTGLLQAWGSGDAAALDQLVPIVYHAGDHEVRMGEAWAWLEREPGRGLRRR